MLVGPRHCGSEDRTVDGGCRRRDPHGDSAIVPTYLVSQFAATELRVMLSGLGGDELFGGYPRYFDGLRSEHAYRALPLGVRKAVSAAIGPMLDDRLQDGVRKNQL